MGLGKPGNREARGLRKGATGTHGRGRKRGEKLWKEREQNCLVDLGRKARNNGATRAEI